MIQHTQDCDDLMTGRALRRFVSAPFIDAAVTIYELTARRDAMRAFEADGRCGCAALALGRIGTELATVRKQINGFPAADQPRLLARKAALIAEREDLRAYLTARNAAV